MDWLLGAIAIVLFVGMIASDAYWTFYTTTLWEQSGPDRDSRNPLWGILIRLNLRMIVACGWLGFASLARALIGPAFFPQWVSWISYGFVLWILLGPTQLGLELWRLTKRGKDADVEG